jgi:signal transduction histidine kinase
VPGGTHTAPLVLLAAAIMVLGAAELLEGLHQTPELSVIEVTLPPIVAGVYATAGIIALVRRPTNWMGGILLLGSLGVLAGGLSLMVSPTLWGVGILASTAILAAMVHALHAFPTGRLRDGWSTSTVIGAWFVSLVLQVPVYLFGPFTPLTPGPDQASFEIAVWIQRGAGLVVMASTAMVLSRRVLEADPRQRRVLAPLYLYGVVAVLLVLLAARVFENVDPTQRVLIQFLLIAGVPVAFVVALLRGGFATTGRLVDLSARLAASAPSRRSLAQALSLTIGDPSCEIVYWSEAIDSFVDDDGNPVAMTEGRAVVEVRIDDRIVGAINYDGVLVGERALVESAARVLALAIDRERLGADLRASHEQLRASRERIVTAADAERRRIARDLHDGLQTRLVLIALAADEAQRSGNAAAVRSLRASIDQAIAELRSFVHGVMPAVLTERGLASAIRELTDDVALPVELDLHIGDARLPPALETAAFLMVSESIGNILKHASASAVRVTAIRDRNLLRIEVSDDGVGGARLSIAAGLGGLRDRIEAVGGTLTVTDARDGGTIVSASLPTDQASAREAS